MPTLQLMYWVQENFCPGTTISEFREEWRKLTYQDRRDFEEVMRAEENARVAKLAARAAN